MTSVSDLEHICGISCRLSTHPLFKAELKRYYEDFHVKEVSLQGELATPTHLLSRNEVQSQLKSDKEVVAEPTDWSTVDLTPLAELLDVSEAERVRTAFSQGEASVLLSEISDKTRRTAVHQLVKASLSFLFTDTVEDGDRKFIRVWTRSSYQTAQKEERKFVATSGGKKRKFEDPKQAAVRFADPWPADRPEFLRFVLHKENRDTAECLGLLARCARKFPKIFCAAGLKDRRGVTSQFVTAQKISREQLQRVVLHPDWDGRSVKISDFSYVAESLRPGMLSGNLFQVVLRGVEHLDHVETAIGNLKATGFLNFFGLQRFGTGNFRTHEIGAPMLNKDWEQVCRKLLGEKFPITAEDASREIEKIWKLDRKLQSVLRTESEILRSLAEEPGNFQVAVNSAIKQKSLYFHALQSFLFNRALSHRIQVHGKNVVVGDLVKIEDDVVFVDETNINNYRLTDVVLPLPGGAIPFYPMNGCDRKFFQSLLDELDVQLETVESQLPGAYRKIAEIPGDLEYRVVEGPEAAKIRLIESDIGKFLPPSDREEPVEKSFDGKPAIVLSCRLPSSAYLTMAVREIAVETSSHKLQQVAAAEPEADVEEL